MIPTQIHVVGEIVDRKERFDKGGRPMVTMVLSQDARYGTVQYNLTATGKSIEFVTDMNVGDIILVSGRFEPMHGNGSYDMDSWRYLNVYVEGAACMRKAHEVYEQQDQFEDPYTEPVQDHPRFCNYGEGDVDYRSRPEPQRRW